MIDPIEETFQVSLHAPGGGVAQQVGFERRVTTVRRTKSVRTVSEGRLIDRFEEQFQRALDNLVGCRGQAKWSELSVPLGDEDPSHGSRVEGALAQLVRQARYLCLVEIISFASICS